MKILVTGGAGFIGSNLVHYLLRHKSAWEIVVADALTYAGNLENIASQVQEGVVRFVRIDIADPSAVNSLFTAEKFDLVFHLAAESHVDRSIHSAAEFVRTNILGTQNLLDSAMACSARFIHISTDEVYGSLGPTGRFRETTPLDPTSPYAASKAGSDLLVLACAKTHKFDAMVTRCTNNYGPYQFPEKFIPLFITNAMEDRELPLYGDGMNVRSWLHVNDHCEALLLVGERGQSGEVYNIGGSEEAEIPNKVVAERITTLLQKPAGLIKFVADRPAHDRRYAIDYTKINRELGWQPQVAFDQGIEQTVRWYQDNQQWWKRIKSGAYLDFYERNYGSRGDAV